MKASPYPGITSIIPGSPTPAPGSQRAPMALGQIAACFFTLAADGPTHSWLESGDLAGQCSKDDMWDLGYKVAPAGAQSFEPQCKQHLWSLVASKSLCREVPNGPNHRCVCKDKMTLWSLIKVTSSILVLTEIPPYCRCYADWGWLLLPRASSPAGSISQALVLSWPCHPVHAHCPGQKVAFSGLRSLPPSKGAFG